MDAHDIEGAANDLYRRAGLDPARPATPSRLAMNLPGIEVQFTRSRPMCIPANDTGTAVIRVPMLASPTALQWFTAHELAEWYLRSEGSEFVEQWANNIAGAIIAPRESVRALRRAVGSDLERCASIVRTTQTIMALRWGETTGEPVAVVWGGRVKRRGDLPDDHELRRIARAGGCEGVRVVRLTDAKRIALIATE